MRILWYLIRRFLIGVAMFFAPVVALVLFAVIVAPFLLSILAGFWSVFVGAYWLFLHDRVLRTPAIAFGIASVVSFAVGMMMVGALVDLAFRLLHPRRQAEPLLEVSLVRESKLID